MKDNIRPMSWFVLFLLIMQTACKKFVEVAPPTYAISSATVYTNDQTAASAMTGVYPLMMDGTTLLSSGNQSISSFCGSAADEFKDYLSAATYAECYTNSMQSSNSYFWPE